MFFKWDDYPDHDSKPTWWGVAVAALAIIVLATSLAFAMG